MVSPSSHRMKQDNETICFRVSPALKKRMEQVAKADDRSLGSWIRQQVARQLRRELREEYSAANPGRAAPSSRARVRPPRAA